MASSFRPDGPFNSAPLEFTEPKTPPVHTPLPLAPLALAPEDAARERGDFNDRESRKSSWGRSTGKGPCREAVALAATLFGVVSWPLHSSSARIEIIG